jgi:hypothetical protein
MGAINDALDAMNSFRDSPRGTLRLSIVRAGAAALQQRQKTRSGCDLGNTVHREEDGIFR